MNILVNNKDDSNENIMIIKPKDISCPKCGEISRINITDYKILLQCKNGHNKGNILLNEYKNTQKIDISKIICDECKINNKSNTYQNIFYRCNKCKKNLCPLCKDNHNKEHKIINYEEKDYICKEHNQKYTSYCEKCKKNLCLFILDISPHFGHDISFGFIIIVLSSVSSLLFTNIFIFFLKFFIFINLSSYDIIL